MCVMHTNIHNNKREREKCECERYRKEREKYTACKRNVGIEKICDF